MPAHPPIDPEVARALAAPDVPPASLHPQDIPAGRIRAQATAPDRGQLARGGAITVTDLDIDATGADRASTPIAALLLTPASGAPVSGVPVSGEPVSGVPVAGEPVSGVPVSGEPVSGAPASGAPVSGAAVPSARTTRDPGAGIVFVHGGGMVMGSRFNIDESMLDAVEMGVTVLSVEYRLAPEHPYPAAVDDCYAAWCWAAGHAADLGIDPDRLAIAGSSAGGGIAAGVTLLARDRGGPLPWRQILFCPMLDDREITPSATELDGEGRWDRTANRTGWGAYLGGRRGTGDVPVYAAPARATDLAGLPPTFVDVGDVETFRDEDIDYAARLSRAGVPVELHLWPGGVHGFTAIAPDAALSRAAMAARRNYLQRMLGNPPGL